MEKQLGRTPQALVSPEFPELLSHLWLVFIDLSNSRSERVPLTYSEIKAYMEVTREPLSPRDIDTIRELDRLWLKVMCSE